MRGRKTMLALACVLVLTGGVLACSSPEAERGDSGDKKYTITSFDFLFTDIPPQGRPGVEDDQRTVQCRLPERVRSGYGI